MSEALKQVARLLQQQAKLDPESLRALFAALLWDVQEGRLSLAVGTPLKDTIALHRVASGAGVQVFAVVMPRLPSLTARRAIFRALRPIAEEHLVVYLTEDGEQALFVAPRYRDHAAHVPVELRALPLDRDFPARTTVEQLAKLSLPLDPAPTLSDVRRRLGDAFSVEAVTQRFFEDYKRVFEQLQEDLRRQTKDARWAHDFALQLLNRLVFLYFIQRKRYADGGYWLGDNPRFIHTFWRAYRDARTKGTNFYRDWLGVLFFEAFNQKFQAGRSDHARFPQALREALATMPYLNGGLFTQNALDTKHRFTVPDDFFAQLFDVFDGDAPGFLERYNFTVSESTPLDVEVAVDPEMIGKVYESLVNVTERGVAEEDRRGMAGIFYTPRVEIDLMCRLAVVDALANRLGDERRALLYDWVFAADPEDKAAVDRRVTEENLWKALDDAVRALTVCDPACGSGSFLVGMLQVLDDLQARCAEGLGREETPYQRRRRIVGEQLYGVDAMDWAVHIAELRLWLQLTVETELPRAEAQLKPLLPNLSFKLRQGDSLVQEVGGVNFGRHRSGVALPAALKGRITRFKADKLRFYQAERARDEAQLRQEERLLFHDILAHRLKALQETRKQKESALQALPGAQMGLHGIGAGDQDRAAAQRKELEATLAALDDEIARIESALKALQKTNDALPFVWDIAFVEVFEGDAGGFDIVIGNPPYVRKQRLAPPTLNPDDFGGEGSARWERVKLRYREKLLRMALSIGAVDGKRSLSGWTDLYVYFYFLAFSLLRPGGTLCFITPNSWLDVGYGRDLQAFFLRKGRLKMVIDNTARRSFDEAEVNTVIVLLNSQAPTASTNEPVRFVSFKRPFDEVMFAETFKAIEDARTPCANESYRVVPVSFAKLQGEDKVITQQSSEAATSPRESRSDLDGKWGKYLRAPDVYRLLEGHTQMIPLRRVAVARLGVTTGANDFFFVKRLAAGRYLTTAFGEPREIALPETCLVPALRSVSECARYEIHADDAAYYLFVADRAPKDPLVRRYIRSAEAAGIHQKPFFRTKRTWYELGELLRTRVIVPEIVYQRYFFAWNADRCALNKNFYGFRSTVDEELLFGLLNFTFSFLHFELTGRKPGAGASGISVSIANQLPIVNPDHLDESRREAVIEAARQLRRRAILDLDEELHQPDRRMLDAALLSALGLPTSAADDLYASLLHLVQARLSKAHSVA